MHLTAVWFIETFLEETNDQRSMQLFAGALSGALCSLWLCCQLSSGRLKLGQVQAKFSLHASKSCSSKVVAAHMVGSHRGKVLDDGFVGRHRASRETEERAGLRQGKVP